jgi:hypothetical protein
MAKREVWVLEDKSGNPRELSLRMRRVLPTVADLREGYVLTKYVPECHEGVPCVPKSELDAKQRAFERACEDAKAGPLAIQLSQAQAEIARLDQAVRDGRTVNAVLVRERDSDLARAAAEIAALKEAVEAAVKMRQWAGDTTPKVLSSVEVSNFDAAMGKLKETGDSTAQSTAVIQEQEGHK